VIIPSGSVRVLVATKPVDFRKGMKGLATLVREAMGGDPFDGTVWVFRAKRPFAQGGLDEAIGLAVGARGVEVGAGNRALGEWQELFARSAETCNPLYV